MDRSRHSHRAAYWLCFAVALMLSGAAAPAHAFNFFDMEVYQYDTDGAGVIGAQWRQNFVPQGHSESDAGGFPSQSMYRSSMALSYGLSNRLDAGAEFDLAHPNTDSLDYAGAVFRLHGRFFDRNDLPLNFGWYTELEWRPGNFATNALESDVRPIIQWDYRKLALTLNPIVEKALSGPDAGHAFEFNYAAKVSYRWREYFAPGVEFYGDLGRITAPMPLHNQEHYVTPVADVVLPAGFKVNFGAGFGLTSGSDGIITKLNIRYDLDARR